MAPQFHGITHLDLSVSNVESSARWYVEVLGLRRIRRDDVPTRSTVLLKNDLSGLFLGISEHDHQATGRFDERGPGLDHLGFQVDSYAELERWQEHFARRGVDYTPIADDPSGVGCALVFRDPDNIQLEMWWTRPKDQDGRPVRGNGTEP